MRIEPTRNLITGLDPRELPGNKSDAAKSDHIPSPTAQGDRIEISLNSELSVTNVVAKNSESSQEMQLTPERISEIQTRINSGFYGSDHVLGQATQEILELYSG